MERSVLHCYALIWSAGWKIIHGDGKTTAISFSRHRQLIPELLGATVVQLFCLTAEATESTANTMKPDHKDRQEAATHSVINRLYGASMRAHGDDLDLPWYTE